MKSEAEIRITELQNEYYKNTTKSWFQKTAQKADCAVTVSQNIPLDLLFKETFYIIPNTNRVYIDYPLFKTFANPTVYGEIVKYVLGLFTKCIETYGTFETHVNLKSFTMTAAQRYREIIRLFCNECLNRDTTFSVHLDQFCIYHSPKMLDAISAIFSGFIDEQIRSKIIIQ